MPTPPVPTPYVRSYSFYDWNVLNPGIPAPGQKWDIEFDNVSTSIHEVIDRLALIQRDDGRLMNGSVGRDQLSVDFVSGVGAPVPWSPSTNYSVSDSVTYNGSWYWALVDHTSGASFNPSLWQFVGAFFSGDPLSLSLGTDSLVDGILSADTTGRAKMANGYVTQEKMDPTYAASLIVPVALINFNAVQKDETYTFSFVGTSVTGTRVGSTSVVVGDFIYFSGQTGNNTILNGSHKITAVTGGGATVTFSVNSTPAGALSSAAAKINSVTAASTNITSVIRNGTGDYTVAFNGMSPTERMILNASGRNDVSTPGACVVSEYGNYVPAVGEVRVQCSLIDGSGANAYDATSLYLTIFKR